MCNRQNNFLPAYCCTAGLGLLTRIILDRAYHDHWFIFIFSSFPLIFCFITVIIIIYIFIHHNIIPITIIVLGLLPYITFISFYLRALIQSFKLNCNDI